MTSTAERASTAMWAEDHASKWMGMSLVEVVEGEATVSLVVEAHHCNGHGILHGGVTFALADTAFAFACNSRGQPTVAQSNTITYLAPGHLGDALTAKAREVHLRGRSGLYDVTVSTETGTVLAEFRGHSRAITGKIGKDAS